MEVDTNNEKIMLNVSEAYYLYTALSERVFKDLSDIEVDLLLGLHHLFLTK